MRIDAKELRSDALGPDYVEFMRRLGMALQPGTWFYPEDAGCVGWSDKPFRPFMLAEPWDGVQPLVRVHPRTTTGSGIGHERHVHEDQTCHLDSYARVVSRAVPAPADCLEEHYECLEPESTDLLKELGLA
jgi:hypothetical protein